MTKILQISDGTTTIDLLDTDGIFLMIWNPNTFGYKDGGLFRESVISPGRVPVYRQDANIVDTLVLGVSGSTQSSVVSKLSALNLLLRNAYDYWKPGAAQFDPVYIVSKADDEVNTKYAVIYKGELGGFTDIYTGPFEGGMIVNGYGKASGFPSLNLVIEHGNWRSHAPNSSGAVPISVVETFNSVNYGNVDSGGTREETAATDEVFVSNHWSPANITHIYRFDSSLASFSSNLISASLPFELFPSPAGNGDICYFGISVGVTGYTPFFNLVFNIGTAAAGTFTTVWEYWNGSAWASLTATDRTDSGSGAFTNTGVDTVVWDAAADWTNTTINSVDAYWVRVRISAFTSMGTIPTQASRDIYAANWPYIEVQSDVINGDLPALLKMALTGTDASRVISRIIIGVRDYARGDSFIPHLNAADEAEYLSSTFSTGATISLGSFLTNPLSPTGKTGRFVAASPSVFATAISWVSTNAHDYNGRFRVFLRGYRNASSATIRARLSVSVNATAFTGLPVTIPAASGYVTADLGIASIQSQLDRLSDTFGSKLTVILQMSNSVTGTSDTIEVFDLVFIPADEWIGEFVSASSNFGIISGAPVTIDGTKLKNQNVATTSNDYWKAVSVASANLVPGKRYRIYFLTFSTITNGGISYPEHTMNVSLNQVSNFSVSGG